MPVLAGMEPLLQRARRDATEAAGKAAEAVTEAVAAAVDSGTGATPGEEDDSTYDKMKTKIVDELKKLPSE